MYCNIQTFRDLLDQQIWKDLTNTAAKADRPAISTDPLACGLEVDSMNARTAGAFRQRLLRIIITSLAHVLCVTVQLGSGKVRADEPSAEAAAFFENQVRPVLVKSCQECHGPTKQRASLRLDSRDGLLRGGDGGPSIVPGKPADSMLVQALSGHGTLKMPPKGKLKDEQIAVLSRWVEIGAPWPGGTSPVGVRSSGITDADRRFWSFQPIQPVPVPPVKFTSWPATDIDHFILAKLEAKGLQPARPAEKATLLRRATYDLHGLPPTPEEIESFLNDSAPDAFARVVDRLLASPRYGERWGRHWLDLVRYADTAGETADYPAPLAYRYRNWVIDALNEDMPYDQFLQEQIAGDILAGQNQSGRYAEQVVATGFLAISRRFGFDSENYQHLTIQDTLDTVGQTVLGLTLGCARCHDHKFDPVTRADYYGLYGIFESTRYAFPGSEQKKAPYDLVPLVPPARVKQAQERKAARLEQLAAEVTKLEKALRQQDPKTVDPALAEMRREHLAESNRTLYDVAYAVCEGQPHNARIHKRGEPADLGDEVPRRYLEVFGGEQVAVPTGSGRLDLARWLTRPENPLTPRVIVNRIWQHHFGIGLVATPNDFGARGRRPTHPELLDYLAGQFRDQGWSMKRLHRQIMGSQVYQLASEADPRQSTLDPENQLLAHGRRRRLDAESLRDTLLLLGGRLDPTPGGAHPFPPIAQWAFTQHAPFAAFYETNRRSIYLMTPRQRRHPFLGLFDGADTNATTPQRSITTVPTQALYLLNDPFVHEQAAGFATRLMNAPGAESSRIGLAYRLALGRLPTTEEVLEVESFLSHYRRLLSPEKAEATAWAALGRSLFARNEFWFVD